MQLPLTAEEALMITPYKVAVPLVALFFILYAWNHVFRGTKTVWEGMLWMIFWGFIAVIVLFPSWISFLTAWTGIKGQANAVFAIVLGIILFVIFHILVRLEKIQNRITEIAQHEALENAGLTKRLVTGSSHPQYKEVQ